MLPWAALDLNSWWDGLTKEHRFVMASAAMIGVLLFGALVIWLVDRWRRRQDSDRGRGDNQMSTFRELYEKGLLTREEYDRIRGKLSTRMLRELEGKKPAEEPGKPPPAATGPPETENPPT